MTQRPPEDRVALLEQRGDAFARVRHRDGFCLGVGLDGRVRARVLAEGATQRRLLMRYLGVLAGHSPLRAEVVPKMPAAPPKQLPLFDEADEPSTSAKSGAKKTAEPSRHPRSWLLQRVFARRIRPKMKVRTGTKTARQSGTDAEIVLPSAVA